MLLNASGDGKYILFIIGLNEVFSIKNDEKKRVRLSMSFVLVLKEKGKEQSYQVDLQRHKGVKTKET